MRTVERKRERKRVAAGDYGSGRGRREIRRLLHGYGEESPRLGFPPSGWNEGKRGRGRLRGFRAGLEGLLSAEAGQRTGIMALIAATVEGR